MRRRSPEPAFDVGGRSRLRVDDDGGSKVEGFGQGERRIARPPDRLYVGHAAAPLCGSGSRLASPEAGRLLSRPAASSPSGARLHQQSAARRCSHGCGLPSRPGTRRGAPRRATVVPSPALPRGGAQPPPPTAIRHASWCPPTRSVRSLRPTIGRHYRSGDHLHCALLLPLCQKQLTRVGGPLRQAAEPKGDRADPKGETSQERKSGRSGIVCGGSSRSLASPPTRHSPRS